MLRYNIVL